MKRSESTSTTRSTRPTSVHSAAHLYEQSISINSSSQAGPGPGPTSPRAPYLTHSPTASLSGAFAAHSFLQSTSSSSSSSPNPDASTSSSSSSRPMSPGASSTGSSAAWSFAQGGSNNEWEETQNKTFCNWLNTRVVPQGHELLTDLGKDFCDGTRLITLVEVLSDSSLGRYNHNPVIRVQKAENVSKALEAIKDMGVHLTNIGPEDIVDGNRKLILGMVWLLVLRFLIANIDEGGSHAKEGLLLWCQRRTQPYSEVDIQNFSRSWTDGLAFCALIHRHRPDLLDYDSLPKNQANAAANTRLAFQIAQDHLGIPKLLDVEDVVGSRKPDEKSVMTYVAQYFYAFSSQAREENEAKLINTFVESLTSVIMAINDYEKRAEEFLSNIDSLLLLWSQSPPSAPYSSLKASASEFVLHKETTKRSWVRDKADVTSLLSHIQTKLKTYGMWAYEPKEGLKLSDLDTKWKELLKAEAERSRSINVLIRTIKEQLRKRFASLANAFQDNLQAISASLAAVDDSLENQLAHTHTLQTQLGRLKTSLEPIAETEQECLECNVDENDYTVYTFDDLSFEYSQLVADVSARKKFVENQIVAREMTNITPENLEDFESVFRTFDKSGSNTLDLDELEGALRSLGLSDKDTAAICARSELTGGSVSFKNFIEEVVQRTEDRVTATKVRNAFDDIGVEKGYVTEVTLKRLNLTPTVADFLRDRMPKVEGHPASAEEGDVYDYHEFLDALLADTTND